MNPTELDKALENSKTGYSEDCGCNACMVYRAAKSHLLHLKQEADNGDTTSDFDACASLSKTSPEQNSPKDSVFVGAKSDTPRTDSEVDHPSNVQLDNECKNRLFGKQITEVVPADFSRTLERELNTLMVEKGNKAMNIVELETQLALKSQPHPDKVRMDWLEQRIRRDNIHVRFARNAKPPVFCVSLPGLNEFDAESLREAIDKAKGEK